MPLIHSKSKEAFKTNVRTLMGDIGKSTHVKDRSQALAIAYETQRRGRAYGGGIAGYDDGGDVTPIDSGLPDSDVGAGSAAGIVPADAAQQAREVAAQRMLHAVKPPEGRQESAFTDALFDALIPGRAAIRNLVSGDYGQAALNAGADLVPAARLVPAPVRRAITGAGIMGAGALMPVNSDEARAEDLTWMTPEQKAAYGSIRGKNTADTRQLRSTFVQQQLALAQARQDRLKEQEQAAQLAKEQGTANAALEERKLAAMREDESARREQERSSRMQAEQDASAELERKSKLPFRERYGDLGNAIQYGSVAASSFVPGVGAGVRNYKVSQLASKLERAMAAGDKTAATLAANQLRQFQNPSTASKIAKGIGSAEVALLPFEGATAIPNIWDYYALKGDESNPNWQNARRQVSPMAPNTELWNNLGMGLIEGVPIGGATHGIVNKFTSPEERAAGIMQSFADKKRWPPAPKASLPSAQVSASAAAQAAKAPTQQRKPRTKPKTPTTSWTGGPISARAGGGGINAVEEAFGDLFKGNPLGQQNQQQQNQQNVLGDLMHAFQSMPNGLSGLQGNVPGFHPQTSPSSPTLTSMTNGMSRLAPTPQGGGIFPNSGMTPMQGGNPVAARNRADGGFNVAKGLMTKPAGWQTRQEARGMMHSGPVLSSVPGRTDAHSTHVPSGSYVIPADVVSGRGQGNTIAGSKALSAMFKMGPFGTSLPHLGHGRGIPRGPKLQQVAHSGGGKGGADSNIGTPTPVNIAGGEVVVPPESLLQVVHPDLDTAHRIMDSWVLHERANHIKTLKGLPGPAKD